MQSLLEGLPLETQKYSYYEPSGLQNLYGGLADATTGYGLLGEFLDLLGSDGGGGSGAGGNATWEEFMDWISEQG